MVILMTKDGTKRDMNFTVCGVSTALGSVSQMCRAGHGVVFNPPWGAAGSYVEHIESGECLWFEGQTGLYSLTTKVAPTNKQTENMMAMNGQTMYKYHRSTQQWSQTLGSQGFARQAHP